MAFALNPQQQQAVHYIDAPLLVIAGAGSGKTRVITEKIAYLLQQCGLKSAHIYAITFTNKAAKEMRERLKKKLGKETAEQLGISTFHTLGLKILKKHFEKSGLRRNFTLFDEQDALGVVQSLTEGNASIDKATAQDILYAISRLKSALMTPEQALSQAQSAGESRIAKYYARYDRQMKSYNAVDFDDLIFLPVQLFQNKPEVLSHWQAQVHYLLVDEYQDTNDSQYQLIKLLMRERESFTIVGDDDQSIYSWRGAKPENLNLLKEDFPRLHLIKLEQNYRSSACILKAANTLIGNNPHVIEKKLWSALGYGDPIRVIHCSDEELEAQRVISEIIAHQFKYQVPYSHYAILYRGNHQALLFEKECRLHKLPYKLSGSTSLFSRAEIKDVLAYLRLIANPHDDSAFLRVVNTPKREIGAVTLQKLGEYAGSRPCSLYQATQEIGFHQTVKPKVAERTHRFTQWLDQKRQHFSLAQIRLHLQTLLTDMDYEHYLHDTSSQSKTAERRWQNVNILIDWIEQLAQDKTDKEMKSALNDILNALLLSDQNEDDQKNQIQLMTLHASKGLEFPNVFLTGMEEGLLPHHVSIEEKGIDEERRLAYVGITRAQRNLTITLAKNRQKFGDAIKCAPSRFLDELHQDDLRIEGHTPVDKNEQKTLNKSKLDDLKALFSKK